MPQLITRQDAIVNKFITYFTGTPCKRGHLSVRFTTTSNCKECQQLFAKENQTRYALKKNFNMTEAHYHLLLEKQNGVCAICQNEELVIDAQSKKVKPLSVDHCHKTNKIRGLLCTNCNLGLGHFKNEAYALKRAAIYCKEFE